MLVLYFVDTMLAMAVMFAGLMRYFMPPPNQTTAGRRAINAEVGVRGASRCSSPRSSRSRSGCRCIFILAASDVPLNELFADETFRGGLVLQAIAAFWSGAGLYRALRTQTPEQLRLKRRFALVFLRWVAVLMVAYTGVVFLFGHVRVVRASSPSTSWPASSSTSRPTSSCARCPAARRTRIRCRARRPTRRPRRRGKRGTKRKR